MKYLLLLTLLIGCGEVDNPSPRYSTHYFVKGDSVYVFTYDWKTGKDTTVGFHKDSMPGLVKLAEVDSVEYSKRTILKMYSSKDGGATWDSIDAGYPFLENDTLKYYMPKDTTIFLDRKPKN